MNQSSLAKECPLSQVLSLPTMLIYEIFKKKEREKPLTPPPIIMQKKSNPKTTRRRPHSPHQML